MKIADKALNFNKIKSFIYLLAAGLVTVSVSSCVREELLLPPGECEEGLATTVKLKIGVPARTIATRADMQDGMDDKVNSLWVAIFSAKTDDGTCLFAQHLVGDNVPVELQQAHGDFAELTINTVSGPCYIVAVANPVNNFGYQYKGDIVSRESLDEILPESAAKAQSIGFDWNAYKNVAIRQLDLNDVNTPIGNLVMSGIYYGSKMDPSAKSWEDVNESYVNIPPLKAGETVVKLDGAVHLRRLISHVKFHIEARDYDGDNQYKKGRRILTIIPQSYQVRNVPYTSWLHERKSASSVSDIVDNKYPYANSGDRIRLNSTTLGYDDKKGDLVLKANYRNSAWFNGNQYITSTREDGKEGFDFDFWMLENKRWATSDLGTGDAAYDKREKEIKDEHVFVIPGDDETADNSYSVEENTGIYTALCGESGIESMNNCASFVEIRCRIVYTDDGLDAIQNEDDYKEVQYRSADAVYTVHLGGVKNNGVSDWNDFTHRRNHQYTYNITVIDVDRIIVEARYDDEPRPGIEGVVTDVVNPPFEVDCHYSVFNIQLSNLERTGGGILDENGLLIDGNIVLDENGNVIAGGGHEVNGGKYERGVFPFRIRYYDENNFAHFIDQGNLDEYINKDGMHPEKELYWTWIEFRPTTEGVIADYKPYSGEGADNQTFRLNEVADIVKFRHPQDHMVDSEETPRRDDKTLYWYTVFVNEYVYETQLDEGANNFVNYVNLSPRMCWMNTLFRSSIDDESNYIRSKYVVRQQSIQTFYDIPIGSRDQDINAIGMEHINETFGFNLRWDNVTTQYEDYLDNDSHTIKNNNGRHNTLLYLHAQTPVTDGTGFSNGSRDKAAHWTAYLNPNRLQYITGINTGSNQYDVSYQLKEPPYLAEGNSKREPYYVTSINTYTNGNHLGASDINTTYFLRILDACMNRNRDNNGNGIIDLEEVRWYVPASSEIVDLVIGRNSLQTPLLDYDLNTQLNSPNGATEMPHQSNTRFHYATSNQRVLWAEEGTTINPEVDALTGNPGWNLPPQNIRCVRALGTNLRTDENRDLTPAFTTNAVLAADGSYQVYPTAIYPTYFEQKNQRSYSSEPLDPHQEMTPLNRLCYYGFEFSKELMTFSDRKQIGTTTIWVYDEYATLPAGWYLPNLDSRSDVEFEGSVKLLRLTTAGSPHPAGWYYPDLTSYTSENKSGDPTYQWFDNVYERYYPGGSYVPIIDTYSEYQIDESYHWFKEIAWGNPVYDHKAGWYKADVTTGPDDGNYSRGGDYVNAWHEGRQMPSGYYRADPNRPAPWDWADGTRQFPANAANGEVLREEGYYLPIRSTYQESAFAGAGYWPECEVGVGEPYEVEMPVFDETTRKTWSDPSGTSRPLFVLPYDAGQTGKINKNQFVADHGSTLALANSVCQQLDRETGRPGWRLPTMKEAALIKVAMDNAGVYKDNGLTYEKYHHFRSGYDVGNFLACTYRQFGVVNEAQTDQTGFYTGVYYPETGDEAQTNDWYDRVGGKLMGRIACITTPYNRHYYIRCVRDLPSLGD